MIALADTNTCTGCSACQAACPHDAIAMVRDGEGFLYPKIDANRCVSCGHCRAVCPVINQHDGRKPLRVLAAIANDNVLRWESSSGGVFSLLAKRTLAQGGIVYGAAVRKADLMIEHVGIEKEEDLSRLRGSKYVQSEMGDTYRHVKQALQDKRQVLFSGTPCQISGLRSCLNREYANLLCVDVICHAVPSPLAWKKYLEARAAEIKGRGSAPAEVFDYRRISFRRKDCGWKRYSLSLGYASDKEYLSPLDQDLFLRGFLSELYNRPSCHHCPCRDLQSGSDLTIADYWDVSQKFPMMDDDKGTSMILVNTNNGRLAVDAIASQMDMQDSEFAHALYVNPAIHGSIIPHRNRSRFFARIEGEGFDSAVRCLLRPTMGQMMRKVFAKVKRALRKALRKVGI